MLTPLMLLLSLPAAAAGEGLSLGASGGWLWFGPGESLEDTWSLLPRVGYGFTPHLAAELELGVHQGATRSATAYRYDALTPRLSLRYTPAPGWPVQPFAAVGPGLLRRDVNRSEAAVSSTPKEDGLGNFQNPDTAAVLSGGPGLLIPLGRAVSLRSDLRMILGFGEGIGDERMGAVSWEWTAGVTIRPAAGPADRDADGVADAEDVCPYEPETINGVRDGDGCPEAPEVLAAAPEPAAAEEAPPPLALERSDDLDGDGLPAYEDACPEEAEDPDGFEDADGCPEPDDDLDGVADADDGCPREAEIVNGFDDGDGCPDEVPEVFEEVSGVVRGITFETGSAALRPQSTPVLEKVSRLLWEYPDLVLRIGGHTDDVGDRQLNIELSKARADAVRAWLVSRGVDEARMETAGYGPDEPLVPNDSPEHRAENRRVELSYTNVVEPEEAP